jgi:hypothetical protein
LADLAASRACATDEVSIVPTRKKFGNTVKKALFLVLLASCALEPSAGTKTPDPPSKMDDPTQTTEDHQTLKDPIMPHPTVGLSLVVGGEPMDAGKLPPPPIPMVAPPQ